MAVIKCPECKEKCSDTVRKCPHCGFIIKKMDGKQKKLIIISIVAVIAVVFGVIIFSNKGDSEEQREESVKSAVSMEIASKAYTYNLDFEYSSHRIDKITKSDNDSNIYKVTGVVDFSQKKWSVTPSYYVADFECTCGYKNDNTTCTCNLNKDYKTYRLY